MGIFNDNYNNPHTANTSATLGAVGPPGPGFKLTADGNYDIDNRKLTKVAEGTDNSDAITKHQLDTGLNTKIDNSEAAPTPDSVAGKLIRYTPGSDLVTKRIYVEDRYNDSVVIESDDQDFDDVTLYIPNLKNYDGIVGRRKSNVVVNSIDNVFTGKIILPSSHLIIKDGNNQAGINRADINKLIGSVAGVSGINSSKCALYDNHGNLYAYSYAIKTGNNVVFIRSSPQTAWASLIIPNLGIGNATIVIDRMDQAINRYKTFSQEVTMLQEGTASNHLVTKAYVDNHSSNSNYLKTDGTNQMLGQINMGNHKVINVSAPTIGTDAANKQYVDSQISNGDGNFWKIDGSNFMTGDLNMNEQKVKNMLDPIDEQDGVNKRFLEAQLHDYLKTDGQNPMTFDLNMNNHKIINLRDTTSSSFDSEAVNKKYVDAEIAKIPSANISTFLKKDGTVAMTGDLNMARNKIKNLGTPTTHENDAAINVGFFNSELNTSNQNLAAQLTAAYKKYVNESHVTPSGHLGENVFRYLMEDVDESSSENNIEVYWNCFLCRIHPSNE